MTSSVPVTNTDPAAPAALGHTVGRNQSSMRFVPALRCGVNYPGDG
jgi:hypothetical protein